MNNDVELRKTLELKFGLSLPSIRDLRTIPLPTILRLKLLPPLPESYNVDTALGGIDDNRVFGNDEYGNCVKAAFAHNVFRFEKFEQGLQIPITDQEVINEYLRETGGTDSGLYLTYAMKDWRNTGLVFNGKTYNIYAFAGVNFLDHNQVKYCIYLLNGLIFGMQVFQTDIDQFRAREPWHLTNNNGKFLGGHGLYAYLYNDSDEINFTNPSLTDQKDPKTGYLRLPNVSKVLTYTAKGIEVMTWGVRQFMDWEFFDQRVLQAYGVVDNRDKWLGDNSPVNVEKSDKQLKEITGTNLNPGCFLPCMNHVIQKIRRHE